jgi:hypothetical protein
VLYIVNFAFYTLTSVCCGSERILVRCRILPFGFIPDPDPGSHPEKRPKKKIYFGEHERANLNFLGFFKRKYVGVIRDEFDI